jgi:MFS superfamily sulfate permease-like transporter
MKHIFTNFLPTIVSVVVPIITVSTFDIYIGLVVGVILMLIVFMINQKLIRQKKKEAIPEVLAVGYYLSFVESLISRMNERTIIIDESTNEKLVIDSRKIEVKVIQPDLNQLPNIKEAINKLQKFSVQDTTQDKSLGVRGNIIEDRLIIYDFPNTLFSLQNYFITEFGNEVEMKKEYTQRFYDRLRKLIDRRISTGLVELRKIEFINPNNIF